MNFPLKVVPLGPCSAVAPVPGNGPHPPRAGGAQAPAFGAVLEQLVAETTDFVQGTVTPDSPAVADEAAPPPQSGPDQAALLAAPDGSAAAAVPAPTWLPLGWQVPSQPALGADADTPSDLGQGGGFATARDAPGGAAHRRSSPGKEGRDHAWLADPFGSAPGAGWASTAWTPPQGGAAPGGQALAMKSAAEDLRATTPSASPRLDPLPMPAFELPAPAGAANAPEPVHSASLAAHPMAAAFGQELGAEVRFLLENGLQRAELHLHPADLGPIQIQLTLDAQTANLSFSAAHPQTREGIELALPELRELLASQGLQLGQAGVGGESPRPGPEDPAPRLDRAGMQPASSGLGSLAGVSAPMTLLLRPGRGMLDLYA